MFFIDDYSDEMLGILKVFIFLMVEDLKEFCEVVKNVVIVVGFLLVMCEYFVVSVKNLLFDECFDCVVEIDLFIVIVVYCYGWVLDE